MPFDPRDPALKAVENRLRLGMDASDAYYDVFQPRRGLTIAAPAYYQQTRAAVVALTGPFSRLEVQQGNVFQSYAYTDAACDAWSPQPWAFLHIHKADTSNFRVYIPADLRHVGDIVQVLWSTPGLTGFKVAGYDDANNRTDVMIAWVAHMTAAETIAESVPSDWLHGMRPPGSDIIRPGSQIGYSREVAGSSMGSEVIASLGK